MKIKWRRSKSGDSLYYTSCSVHSSEAGYYYYAVLCKRRGIILLMIRRYKDTYFFSGVEHEKVFSILVSSKMNSAKARASAILKAIAGEYDGQNY